MGVNGIYGLSGSGIDVESMVKVGMLSKQKEYDKMQQTYTKNEWTKQAYNEIYTKLTTYSTSTLSPYKMSSNMSAKTAVSSNENAVTATPNGNAVVMNHRVAVEQLSSSPYLVATQSLQALDSSAESGSVRLQDYIFTKGTYNMIEQSLVVSDADGNELEDIDVDDIAFEFKVSDGTTDDAGVEKTWTLSYTYGDLLGVTKRADDTIQYNENTEKTFNDFISDFNALGSNIKASYDSVGGKFSFYNKYGGESAKIAFELTTDEERDDAVNEAIQTTTKAFFQGMKLAQSINGELKAQDADGNLVDFYAADGSGIVGDNYYIGSGNAGSGSSAALASSAALTYTDDDNNEVTVKSSTALTNFIDGDDFNESFSLSINGSDPFTISYQAPAEDAEEGAVGTFIYTKYQTTELDNANSFASLLGADSVSYELGVFSYTMEQTDTLGGDLENVDFSNASDDYDDLLDEAIQGEISSNIAYNATSDKFVYEVTQTLDDMAELIGAKSGSLSYDSDEETFTYTRNGSTVTVGSDTFLNSLTSMLDSDYASTLNLRELDWKDAWDSTCETFSFNQYQTRAAMADILGVKSIEYDASEEQLSYVHSVTTDVNSEEFAALIGAESVDYDINTEKFSYVTVAETGDISTVGDFVNLINADSDTTKVQASFDDSAGTLTLASTVKGSNSSIEITSNNDTTAEEFLSAFKLKDTNGSDSVTSSQGAASEIYGFGITGQYGSAIVDGVRFDKLTDNSVTAYGVTYKLHNTTVDDSGTAQTIGINVEQDVDSIVDRVKSFVEDYNKLLGAIYDKYDEKQYKDYKPLTASQKESMKDEQVEKWEEKAKSGLLYHDQTLSKITTKMREAISQPIDGLSGKYTSVFSLGISTTGIHGQLTLDEDKLRAALDDDSESVYNVFSTLSKDDTFSENGVAQRLSDVMIDATKLIKERAGTDDSINDDSDLGSLMRQLQNKMSDFKKLLDAFETKLYKKYDAMEVALSTLGTQLSFITGGQ